LYVDPVKGDDKPQAGFGNVFYLYIQGGKDGFDGILGNFLPDEVIDLFECKEYLVIIFALRVKVYYIGTDGAPAQFPDEQGRPFEGIFHIIDVYPPFKTEGGIGIQPMSFCRFPYRNGVEIRAFEKDGFGIFGYPGINPAKDPRDTHGFLAITDHQVFAVHNALFPVEGHKAAAGLGGPNHYFFPINPVGIESMQRLPQFVKHVVGSIHHVIDRL